MYFLRKSKETTSRKIRGKKLLRKIRSSWKFSIERFSSVEETPNLSFSSFPWNSHQKQQRNKGLVSIIYHVFLDQKQNNKQKKEREEVYKLERVARGNFPWSISQGTKKLHWKHLKDRFVGPATKETKVVRATVGGRVERKRSCSFRAPATWRSLIKSERSRISQGGLFFEAGIPSRSLGRLSLTIITGFQHSTVLFFKRDTPSSKRTFSHSRCSLFLLPFFSSRVFSRLLRKFLSLFRRGERFVKFLFFFSNLYEHNEDNSAATLIRVRKLSCIR